MNMHSDRQLRKGDYAANVNLYLPQKIKPERYLASKNQYIMLLLHILYDISLDIL